MNHKANEFFSKVEKVYDIKLGRHMNCPICRQEGTPQNNNPLVMEHRASNERGIVFHRWSFSSGRVIRANSEDFNVL